MIKFYTNTEKLNSRTPLILDIVENGDWDTASTYVVTDTCLQKYEGRPVDLLVHVLTDLNDAAALGGSK